MVFLMLKAIPGDATFLYISDQSTPEEIEAIRTALGLDEPIYIQYTKWLGRVVQGDLGYSAAERRPVFTLLMERFPNTVMLTIGALTLSTIAGLTAGVMAALKPGSRTDRGITVLALLGTSMPGFWFALVLIVVFALGLGLFPTSGMYTPAKPPTIPDLLWHMVLPCITMGTSAMALVARMTRSSVIHAMRQDYIRTARAKGLGERVVVIQHGLKNALIPIITVLGLQFGNLLGGTTLIETVFAWPGMGTLIVNAISKRDVMLVQGGVLMVAAIFVAVNIAVDLMYAYVDPRIRYA
jgi:peptide/nickel transport system permease protein